MDRIGACELWALRIELDIEAGRMELEKKLEAIVPGSQ
jgi:hypothetical protein